MEKQINSSEITREEREYVKAFMKDIDTRELFSFEVSQLEKYFLMRYRLENKESKKRELVTRAKSVKLRLDELYASPDEEKEESNIEILEKELEEINKEINKIK